MAANKEIVNINEALQRASLDSKVGIAIVRLAGNDDFALYAAEIAPGKFVTAHYHNTGSEIYQIVEGSGEMFTGYIQEAKQISWNEPLSVKTGDCFTVQESEIHQLKNTTDKKLIAIFGCPNSHLNQDRFIVEGMAK